MAQYRQWRKPRRRFRQNELPFHGHHEETHRVYFLVDPAMLGSLQDESDVAAILQGVADAESGRVRPLDEAMREIESRLRARFAK